jgi:MFS family permease
VCQALASGLGGYLGHTYNRVNVLALGCFIWGTTTLMFSFTSNVGWGAFAWAWNGVGLSFVIPNTQSLVADYYTEDNRGTAFGTLATTGACFAATVVCSGPTSGQGVRVLASDCSH